MKRTVATAAMALGLAVAVSACSSGSDPSRPRRSAAPSPSSTHGPLNAILGDNGLVSKLPDTCQAVRTSLPEEMVDTSLFDSYGATKDNFLECEWSSFSSDSARVYNYRIWQFDSRAKTREELGFDRHATDVADSDCRYKTADIKAIPKLGEEAFAVPCTYKKYSSPFSDTTQVYEVSGANLVFRTRNVVVRAWWTKADYPASEANKKPHWLRGGKQLTYQQALPQMIEVAKAILTHFPST